jgi:hypothetical protein
MKSNTDHQGRIYLWRKFLNDWKGKHPLYRSAWTWILLNAVWNPEGFNGLMRGQVRFSVKQAKKLWGLSPTQARRFLKACVEDGSISWQKGKAGRPITSAKSKGSEKYLRHGAIEGGNSGGNSGAIMGVITVLKYNEYQATVQNDGAIHGAIEGGNHGASYKEYNKEKNDASPSASGSPREKSSKKVSKETDPRVKQLIDYFCAIHQAKFDHKYTVSGARDGQIFKTLLADHSLDTLKTCIQAFFDDQDEWLNGKRTIAVLRSRVNQYIQQLSTQQAAPVPAAFSKAEIGYSDENLSPRKS